MKGVIVAAGYGTRFFPMTKTVPKELLPMYDRPCIDFILDEFEEAGIRDVVVITSRRKKALDDYFDREVEVTDVLLQAGKTQLAEAVKPRDMNFIFIRQQEMKGTGHALLLTKHVIGDEAFVVAYPDDLVISKPGLTKRMVELYEKHDKSILAVRHEAENVSRYGVIEPEERDGVTYMKRIVEKPEASEAPSDLVSIGRYLFKPELLELLEKQYESHKTGEFYHIDAINHLASRGGTLACIVEGLMLDTGEPATYLQSILEYAYRSEAGRKTIDEFVKKHY